MYGSAFGYGHSKTKPGATKQTGSAASVVSLTSGYMDCSGLTRYAYSAIGLDIEWSGGVKNSGSWSVGTTNQKSRFNAIAKADRLPGDVLFKPGHIAIYIGGDKMVEATTPGHIAKISTVRSDLTYMRIKPELAKKATGAKPTTTPTPTVTPKPTTTTVKQVTTSGSGTWWGTSHWNRLSQAIGQPQDGSNFGRSPAWERYGATSSRAKSLQSYLNAQDGGLTANITVDGAWGPATTEKLRAVIDRKCGLTKLGIYGAVDGKGANGTIFDFNADEAAALAKCLNSKKF